MANAVEKAFGNYAIEQVGWYGYRVIRTDKEKPFHMVSVLYDGADARKRCWDWLVHNVNEAIHFAPSWYIKATHDAL